MFVIVSYDVATSEDGGQRRLRRVARACKDYGQRVQFSVFECIVDPAQWAKLKDRLISEIDPVQVCSLQHSLQALMPMKTRISLPSVSLSAHF